MTKRIEGKVALITGGSSGIGRATAVLFAREGAKVVVAARRRSESEETLSLVRQAGSEGLFVRADVSCATDCQAMVELTINTYGRLDIAFNNAGIGRAGRFVADEEEEAWEQVMAINLKGVFLSMKYEIIAMLRNGGGSIVNTSSVGGLVAGPGLAIYQASKHGVIGLTKAAALEYAAQGIRINAVCPGVTRSEMVDRWFRDPTIEARITAAHPMGRVATPEEIAQAVLFLASNEASFVTGQAFAVDGGYLAQ
ncbi:MAG: SDR family oxidoreductase [Acidobacteriota bacterium]